MQIKKRGKISYSFIKVTTPILSDKLFHATPGVCKLILERIPNLLGFIVVNLMNKNK